MNNTAKPNLIKNEIGKFNSVINMERTHLETPLGSVSFLERTGDFPIIFLHGLGGSGNNWLKLAAYIPERYRLVMPDLAGHGRSRQDLAEYSVREQVDFLRSFIEVLGLRKYALVGNSYGGWVAMKYSATVAKPDALVLLDSAGINPTVGESSEEDVSRFVDRVMNMNPRNERENITRFVRKNATGEEKLTSEELSRLPSKTLIIWGARDRLIPLEYAKKLHSSIHGSILKILEDGGHTPHTTNAKEVSKAIVEFLDQ